MSWNPKHWASLAPNGIGHVKPNHYLDMAKVVWRNRDQLPYAWRILSQGVCDGCALGTSGLHDFTMDGVHLCMVRLELLRLNTMPALDVRVLEAAEALAQMSAAALRELGRLPYPMLRRRGARGFTRITWDEALQLAADKAAATDPQRLAFYLTSRGLTNEAYYVTQKAARFLGTNNVDNSARICHAPSTVAMKQALGVAASTVSYKDWIGTDLLVLFGSNTPNNQPVTTKYIYYAKQQGTRVVVINPYREPGLERYWVPSVTESALFGTKLADEFFQVHTGGDRAFIAGVLKHLIENDWTNAAFIAAHTTGFDELKTRLRNYEWDALEAAAGTTRDEMGGSHYQMVTGESGGEVPRVDIDLAPRLFAKLHEAIKAGLVRSCHDLSEGGLAVALAEMAFAGMVGADVTGLKDIGLPDHVALFSECPTRFVLEVTPDNLERFRSLWGALPLTALGKTVAEKRLRIAGANGEWIIWAGLDDLKESWQQLLR